MSEKDPEKLPPAFIAPTLDYRSGQARETVGVATGSQVAFGFLAWVVAVIVVATYWRSSRLFGLPVWVLPGACAGTLLFLTLWLRFKWRWRYFSVGILLGFGITCLVPIGIAAVICGNSPRI